MSATTRAEPDTLVIAVDKQAIASLVEGIQAIIVASGSQYSTASLVDHTTASTQVITSWAGQVIAASLDSQVIASLVDQATSSADRAVARVVHTGT